MAAKYVKRSSHIGPATVRFIPVANGDVVELGDTAPNTTSFYASRPRHIYLGFKPGAGPRANGWIVVLVDESAPAASKPIKRRSSPVPS
jgi:hypothetical protein